MSLDKFKKVNELDQGGLNIDECKSKIVELLKKQENLDNQFEKLENDFVLRNKDKLNKFLTQELNFIETKENKEEVYDFKNEDYKCKIRLKFEKFNTRNYVSFYMNNNRKEYCFLCDYKDIEIEKICFKLEDNWNGEELKRTDSRLTQDNKKYWNEELEIAEKAYNNNYESFSKINKMDDKERFIIKMEEDNGDYNLYDDLKELIRNKLEE